MNINLICHDRYYTLISMAYITSIIASIIFFNKFIVVGDLFTSASLISYSMTYFFGNAVAEVYGFDKMRRLIIYAIICGNAFTVYCHLLLMIPSPSFETNDLMLSKIIGGSFRSSVAGTIAMLSGAYVSSYIMGRIFLFGNRRWIKYFVASSCGEAINTLLVFPLGMVGSIPIFEITDTMISAYVFKILFVVIQVIPYTFFVHFLKKSESKETGYSLNT